jgi:hypothetical protein
VSYLPDLQAYLDDLLRNRERLLATNDLDDWARTEATPSDEEISKIRRLIARINTGLNKLAPDQREQVEPGGERAQRGQSVQFGGQEGDEVFHQVSPVVEVVRPTCGTSQAALAR